MNERHYYVYLMTNYTNSVIYTGVTNDVARRVEQHRLHSVPSFTSRYKVWKLVYVEVFDDPMSAITREKQIKGGSRAKKVALIEADNPTWRDLSTEL